MEKYFPQRILLLRGGRYLLQFAIAIHEEVKGYDLQQIFCLNHKTNLALFNKFTHTITTFFLSTRAPKKSTKSVLAKNTSLKRNTKKEIHLLSKRLI
jgi:hypothetical protein